MNDDHHAQQLEKELKEVEGGLEVLYSRTIELGLSPDRERVLLHWNKLPGPPEEESWSPPLGFVRRGTGILLPDFWKLPRPDDPEGSVRCAVEEDRR